MSACPALTYSGVSAAAWAAMKSEVLAQYGISITSDFNQASDDGITILWHYDGTALLPTLTLQCTDSPFFLSCDQINSTIDALVKQCLAANP